MQIVLKILKTNFPYRFEFGTPNIKERNQAFFKKRYELFKIPAGPEEINEILNSPLLERAEETIQEFFNSARTAVEAGNTRRNTRRRP